MSSLYIESSSFVRCLQERALDKFLASIDIRYDFQKHIFRGITLVVINLNRAVMCESQLFYRYIFNLIDEGAEKIVIDLTSIEFIDSSFAGVLVASLRRVRPKGGEIRLVLKNLNSLSNQIFFNGVVKIYKTYSSVKEALNSFETDHEKSTLSAVHLSSQK